MSYEELDRLGIQYHRDYKYVKDDEGKNIRDEKGQLVQEYGAVKSVLLPLSSVQWCHIAMREGAHYVGGCCGHTSAMQDIINAIFRDGGWAPARELRELAELAQNHDGFEAFDSTERVESLEALDDPWEIIGAVWCAVEDVLAPGIFSKPREDDVLDFDRALWLAKHLMWQVSLAKFFTDDAEEKDSMRNGQRHVNRVYSMLRILPPLRTIYNHLEKMSDQSFPGFGVRKKGTEEVVANGHGLCLYEKREQAEELFRIWREAGDKDVDDWEIVPCGVTVTDGLKWVE